MPADARDLPQAAPPPVLAELAPAKINLCLHVTGKRADGYHLLDSLVAFAGIGDRLQAEPAPQLSLSIDGPFGADLGAGPDNLVLRAATALGLGAGQGAAFRLTKTLPVASGIGGGSADAAAALRLLSRIWSQPLPGDAGLALGADVPVCLASKTARMEGIGERLTAVPQLPPVWLLLVNDRQPISTGAVFSRLASPDNPGLPPLPQAFADARALADWLATTRNDLEPPARAAAPNLGRLLEALAAQPDCLLARMSGSGGTCFGLFASEAGAQTAQASLTKAQPNWWTAAAPILVQS